MYDELVKRLRNRRICIQQLGTLNDYPLLGEAADAIEQLDMITDNLNYLYKTEVPKWIPVTERLPEEHVFVLIRQDDDRMMVAVRVDGDWWYRYFAYDVDRWDENEQGTITHWMPLPEPPKEET